MVLSRKRATALVLFLVAVLMITPQAEGHRAVGTDQQGDNTDPDGDSTPLDIASVTWGHRKNPSTPAEPREVTLKLEMYGDWDNSVLDDRAHQIGFHILNRSDCVCRALYIQTTQDGTLYAEIIGGRDGPAKFYGYAKVWRPDVRTVKVSFRKRQLGRHLNNVGVRALTSNTGGECQRPSGDSTEPCEDVVPDEGFLFHDFRD
jgi:hypothetical protein